jgi:UDP-N-acetylglucosamine 2-epimerase
VVTVHRAESTDTAVLGSVLGLLSEVARAVVPLIFPVHPRTRAAIHDSLPDWRAPSALAMVEPLGPMDMLRLTQAAAVVITDSGGLQKEAFMLGRPCVTLRGETEWLETIAAGANILVGQDVSRAVAAVRHALEHGAEIQQAAARQVDTLYGQGQAAERCVARILQLARVS